MTEPATVNDRRPNFRKDGRLYLVRCFACEPERGTENYVLSVTFGQCAWCGWKDPTAGGHRPTDPVPEAERPL
jgi:hypothetical protein